VEIAEQGRTARLEPVLTAEALRARLDGVLGVDGWSNRFLPFGASLICELILDGVTKSVVASAPAAGASAERLAQRALTAAAAHFGLYPPADDATPYWVDFDPEAGEPLYLPEPLPRAAAADARASEPGTDDGQVGRGPADAAPSAPVVTAEATAGAPATAAGLQPVEGAKPEGREVIERLVERLKAGGRGREVAALVVEYGGYGRTPEEARELYRRLRELLKTAGAPA